MPTAFDHNVAAPGTVEAGEAVILDANKDATGIRNLDVTNLDAGASGTAGSVDVFPSTASKGKLALTCTDQTGNTTVALVAGAMAAARTITIPDPGAAASLVMTQGNQTLAGLTTLARSVDSRFNPYTRVWAMSSFNNRLYTKAVVSDWSVHKSVASANQDWVVSGSATTYGGVANSTGAAILSGSNSGAYAFIKPRTGSQFDRIKWKTNLEPEFDFVIKTGTLLDARIAVGLFSATYPRGNAIGAESSGSNRIEVYIDQDGTSRAGTGSGGSWRVGVAGSGVSSVAVSTGTNASSSTIYHVNIRVSSGRILTVYINDMTTPVYTSTLALTTATALVPMVAIQSEGAKRNMSLVHIIGSQNAA